MGPTPEETAVVALCRGVNVDVHVSPKQFGALSTAFRGLQNVSRATTQRFLRAVAGSCAKGHENRVAAGPASVAAVVGACIFRADGSPTHVDTVTVLYWLRSVKLLMCGPTDADLSAANAVSFVEHGGLLRIATAMHKHRGNAMVQEYGALALRSVCICGVFCEQVVSSGCLGGILTGMETHPQCTNVQESGIMALYQMTRMGSGPSMAFAGAGGLAILCTAMDRHLLSSRRFRCRVQTRGCSVLGHVARCVDLNPEALQRVFNALHTFPHSYSLSLAAEKVFTNVAVFPPPSIACAFYLMETHPTRALIQRAAAGALLSAARMQGVARAMVVAGGEDLVHRAMATHRHDRILQMACSALVLTFWVVDRKFPDEAPPPVLFCADYGVFNGAQ